MTCLNAWIRIFTRDKPMKNPAFDKKLTESITLIAISPFHHGILALIPNTDISPNNFPRAVTCSSISSEKYL